MDYEKLHKDTIAKLQEMVNSGKITVETARGICADFVPESEDERIRKELLAVIDDLILPDEQKERFVAWLKKQGEQKSADKVEPKFHEGEWVFIEEIKGYKNGPFKIKIVDSIFGYCFDEYHVIPFMYEDLLSKWTIQDAKDGDLIYVATEEKGVQAIFHEYKNNIIFFHCYLCRDFVQGGYMPIGSVELVYPLQETHYNRFFEKMHEAWYEWDAEKKELKKIEQDSCQWPVIWCEEDEYRLDSTVSTLEEYAKTRQNEKPFLGVTLDNISWLKSFKYRIQPKQEWSEEDEAKLKSILFHIEDVENKDVIDWLKSLKDRYTWKPSDEQMKILNEVLNFAANHESPHWNDYIFGTLNNLIRQLKKLREE